MLKKKLFLVAALMVTSLTGVQAQERAIAKRCPSCGNGVITTTTTRRYEHDETFPCTHKSHGTDRYSVYAVTSYTSCNMCSYSKTSKTEDHVFVSCNGY